MPADDITNSLHSVKNKARTTSISTFWGLRNAMVTSNVKSSSFQWFTTNDIKFDVIFAFLNHQNLEIDILYALLLTHGQCWVSYFLKVTSYSYCMQK